MNTRSVKAKGREAEKAVVEYLRGKGFPAERRRLTGAADCGDVSGVSGWVLEVKAERRLDLPGYLRELASEIKAADLALDSDHRGAVIVKKRGSLDASKWYAVLTLEDLVGLMLELARASGTEPHSLT